MDSRQTDLSRRDLIKLGAAATVAASLGVGAAEADQSSAPAVARAARFLTADELALVDELSELIIPADAHSPGARAAGVAAYIDARLAESWDEKVRTEWRAGLDTVNRLSQEISGRRFVDGSTEQRTAVLTRMALNESKPEKPEELFFASLKSLVVKGYYTSEIGIKQEMEYQGNSYLTEFVGTDVS
jgi:hypothetical protein